MPATVLELCRRLEQAGYRAWVVGGGLRDVLMERPPKDWDLATTATPAQVMKVFKRTVPTGVEHGTVTVLLAGGSYEVTTLRGEGACPPRQQKPELREHSRGGSIRPSWF